MRFLNGICAMASKLSKDIKGMWHAVFERHFLRYIAYMIYNDPYLNMSSDTFEYIVW